MISFVCDSFDPIPKIWRTIFLLARIIAPEIVEEHELEERALVAAGGDRLRPGLAASLADFLRSRAGAGDDRGAWRWRSSS